jgi:cell division protein YceG involved in septum cleavage
MVLQLSKNPNLEHDIYFESSLYLMSKDDSFCKNDFKKLEGCLLLDNYLYNKGTKSSQIFKRAFNAMRLEVDNAWGNRFDDIPIKTSYQALVLAPIIAKRNSH